MAALLHRNPASAETSYDSCCAKEYEKKKEERKTVCGFQLLPHYRIT